jgi:hypothetical protein
VPRLHRLNILTSVIMNVDCVPFRERVRADHVPTVSDLAWSLAGAGADECMAVDHRRRSFPLGGCSITRRNASWLSTSSITTSPDRTSLRQMAPCDTTEPRPAHSNAKIIRIDWLGGNIHEYSSNPVRNIFGILRFSWVP